MGARQGQRVPIPAGELDLGSVPRRVEPCGNSDKDCRWWKPVDVVPWFRRGFAFLRGAGHVGHAVEPESGEAVFCVGRDGDGDVAFRD